MNDNFIIGVLVTLLVIGVIKLVSFLQGPWGYR